MDDGQGDAPGSARHLQHRTARPQRAAPPEINVETPVAEFAIGAILAETRLITRGHESLRRGEWRGELYRADLTGEELSEMTVGVIGYGHGQFSRNAKARHEAGALLS